jgi:hypothetical protein
VIYATRKRVGSSVGEPTLVFPSSARLRFDIWASKLVSMACCGDVAAVEGLLPTLERALRPLRVLLELLPLFTLAVSEGPMASAPLVGVVVGEDVTGDEP